MLQCAAVHGLSRISHQCLPDGKHLYASKTVNEQSLLYLATLSTFPRIPYPCFVVLIETSCSLLVLAAYRVMAKGDGREVGDCERTGYSCVFISCSWYMHLVKICVIFKTFESLLILILTTGYLYKEERSCMISLHDIMLITVLIAKGMYLEV